MSKRARGDAVSIRVAPAVRLHRKYASVRPHRRMVASARRTFATGVRSGGFLGIESKFKDFRVNTDPFTDVWAGGEMEDATALSVSAVAQGDGESERDGRVYHITSIHIRGTISIVASESQTAPIDDLIARVCLVWDKQTNAAQLNAEDVMLTIAAGDDIDSFRNLQFVNRFEVLSDKKFRLPAGQANTNEGAVNLFANGRVILPFRMSHKFKTPLKVNCVGTTAVIASIADNSLHIIGTAQNTSARLDYTSRLRFMG